MSNHRDVVEVFDGIRFPGFMHTTESLKAACSFEFQDTDVLLVTFPKSGEKLKLGPGRDSHTAATLCPQGPSPRPDMGSGPLKSLPLSHMDLA
jgi:hypothetical protein